jgi:hypothetical protein
VIIVLIDNHGSASSWPRCGALRREGQIVLQGGRGGYACIGPDPPPLLQITAMQSTSISNGPGHEGTCKKMRAGASAGKYRA